MKYCKLGKNGPVVSRVGFGAWAIGGLNWGPTDDEVSREALQTALDKGVTLIDTADVYGYGHSENLIREVLSDNPSSDVVIATKAGNDFYNATPEDESGYGRIRLNGDRDYLVWAAEQSLKRLDTDCLDILQLHSLETRTLEREDPWKALADLKETGKIRFAGWSVKSYKETEQAHLLDRYRDLIDCVQVRYNLLEREAEKVLFPKCQEYGIGVIVRIPLFFGLLTGKFDRNSRFSEEDHRSFNLPPEKLAGYLDRLDQLDSLFAGYPGQSKAQVSLRFCISHPACHTVIPGGKTPRQVDENCKAGESGAL